MWHGAVQINVVHICGWIISVYCICHMSVGTGIDNNCRHHLKNKPKLCYLRMPSVGVLRAWISARCPVVWRLPLSPPPPPPEYCMMGQACRFVCMCY